MVDIVMDPERGLLQDGRTAQEFLVELFEYEYCAECGGYIEDHIVVLRAEVDLTSISEGSYFLGLRQPGLEWMRFPIRVF